MTRVVKCPSCPATYQAGAVHRCLAEGRVSVPRALAIEAARLLHREGLRDHDVVADQLTDIMDGMPDPTGHETTENCFPSLTVLCLASGKCFDFNAEADETVCPHCSTELVVGREVRPAGHPYP